MDTLDRLAIGAQRGDKWRGDATLAKKLGEQDCGIEALMRCSGILLPQPQGGKRGHHGHLERTPALKTHTLGVLE